MHVTERTAGHGKVLSEHGYRITAYATRADDNAVTGKLLILHTEIVRVELYENVILMERVLIEQSYDTLASGKLTHGFLLLDGFETTAEEDLLFLLF